MPHTYTQLNTHAVFAVKGRNNYLTEIFSLRLMEYISGILTNLKQFPLAVGGYKNHVHIFFEQNPDTSLSDIMEKVKANSSRWINENNFLPQHFEWQRGYGGFSYARSQRNDVIHYIMNQEDHHRIRSFKEEYLEILNRFEIDFEDRYLFEFYD
ncbi:MAG: IS200/IS605 family transposase [Bacteroidota bacterium]